MLITRFQDFRVIAKFYHGGQANMAFSIKKIQAELNFNKWNSIQIKQTRMATNHPPPSATTETQPKH